jgi:hypothetical protein
MIMLKQGIDSLDGRYEMTPAARTAAAKRFRTAELPVLVNNHHSEQFLTQIVSKITVNLEILTNYRFGN